MATILTNSLVPIFVGLLLAAVTAIAGLVDLVRRAGFDTLAWPHAVGYVLAVIVSLVNMLVHSRDGYTAVVPTGLALSGLVVVVLILTAWAGMALANRQRVRA